MINNLIEYMKIHLISLEQDLEKATLGQSPYPDIDYVGRIPLNASISTTRHFLSVAEDILNNDHQGKGY